MQRCDVDPIIIPFTCMVGYVGNNLYVNLLSVLMCNLMCLQLLYYVGPVERSTFYVVLCMVSVYGAQCTEYGVM